MSPTVAGKRVAPALLLAVWCAPAGSHDCRPPSGAERVYPFTGAWQNAASGEIDLCLYQPDARSVVGTLAGHQAAGAVHPDGALVLGVAGKGGPTAYALTLRYDTLTVEYLVQASPRRSATTLAQRWFRRGPSPIWPGQDTRRSADSPEPARRF